MEKSEVNWKEKFSIGSLWKTWEGDVAEIVLHNKYSFIAQHKVRNINVLHDLCGREYEARNYSRKDIVERLMDDK